MYRIKQDADRSYIVYIFDGQPVVMLEGGYAEVIVMTFMNMGQHDIPGGGNRGDDYMAGVVAGIMHMQMLRPDCFNLTIHTPDEEIGPDPRLLDPY